MTNAIRQSPPSSLAIRSLRVTIGIFFIVTAFLKAWDIPGVAGTMRYLRPFMRRSIHALISAATVVIIWEIVLGWMLAMAFHLRMAAWCALGTIVVLSCVLVILWIDGKAPSCGCTGRLAGYVSWLEHPGVGLIRNGLLIAGLHELLRRLPARLRSETTPVCQA